MKFIANKYIDKMYGVMKSGKESSVYLGIGDKNMIMLVQDDDTSQAHDHENQEEEEEEVVGSGSEGEVEGGYGGCNEMVATLVGEGGEGEGGGDSPMHVRKDTNADTVNVDSAKREREKGAESGEKYDKAKGVGGGFTSLLVSSEDTVATPYAIKIYRWFSSLVVVVCWLLQMYKWIGYMVYCIVYRL